jgi:hypothetical protein
MSLRRCLLLTLAGFALLAYAMHVGGERCASTVRRLHEPGKVYEVAP